MNGRLAIFTILALQFFLIGCESTQSKNKKASEYIHSPFYASPQEIEIDGKIIMIQKIIPIKDQQ